MSCRQGSVEPYTLVEGPGAWYGKDYQHNIEEWAIRVTAEHIAELEGAIARVLNNKTITQDGNYLNIVSDNLLHAAGCGQRHLHVPDLAL